MLTRISSTLKTLSVGSVLMAVLSSGLPANAQSTQQHEANTAATTTVIDCSTLFDKRPLIFGMDSETSCALLQSMILSDPQWVEQEVLRLSQDDRVPYLVGMQPTVDHLYTLEDIQEQLPPQPTAAESAVPAKANSANVPRVAIVSQSAENWRSLVASYFQSGDVDFALVVLACESKGDSNAVNPKSGASGLFQHMPKYWAERSSNAGWGGANIMDPTANVAVAAWMVYEMKGGGWGHWVCA